MITCWYVRVSGGRCQTDHVTEDEPPPSLLFVEMERRREDPTINLPAEGTANWRTRRKIRLGVIVEDDVYRRLDTRLKWVAGDAKRAAVKDIPPRPVEGSPQALPVRRLRRLEVAAMFGRVSAMLADSPDDVDPAVLTEAERLAQKALEELERQARSRDAESNGAQRRR